MKMNVQTLCTMRIIGSYTFQPLWVSVITNVCIKGDKTKDGLRLDFNMAYLVELRYLHVLEDYK